MEKRTYHQMDTVTAKLLAAGVAEGVFPGAAAAVSWGSGSGRQKSYGVAGIKDNRFPNEPVTTTTFFDLASLSKALSTTLVLYSLINENKIALNNTLGQILSPGTELPLEKENITISLLLSHSSGFAGYKEYFKKFPPHFDAGIKENYKDILLGNIIREPLVYRPGSKCIYSDLGFILLGKIIEKMTGTGLDSNFKEQVAVPLGIKDKVFYLSEQSPGMDKFAATEKCPWRGRIIRSEVHDEHCWLMNGIAGHAGLFGSVEGVMCLCEAILDQWKGKEKKYSWSTMLARGLQKKYQEQSWCLGFDTPSAGSSSGSLFSQQSVGHLGYAGTSFWIDPEKELIIVLLTNRVHPDRKNIKIRKFRPWFHDAVVEYLQGKNLISQ